MSFSWQQYPGGSKQTNVVKFEDSDDDEDNQKWASKQKEPEKKKEKEASILGRVFNKPKPAPAKSVNVRRKIVDERWELSLVSQLRVNTEFQL